MPRLLPTFSLRCHRGDFRNMLLATNGIFCGNRALIGRNQCRPTNARSDKRIAPDGEESNENSTAFVRLRLMVLKALKGIRTVVSTTFGVYPERPGGKLRARLYWPTRTDAAPPSRSTMRIEKSRP